MEFDYLIVGAGIIGLTIAHELVQKFPDLRIAIVEKENDVAMHASGRNSGVIHAGFYYSADSLKAKLTARGNERMQKFCVDHDLPLKKWQKIVVAKDATELKGLEELYSRGIANGVNVELIDEPALAKISPNIKTYQRALLSPNTASTDPKAVCLQLKKILMDRHVQFYFNEKVKRITLHQLKTTQRTIRYKYLFNCAGLYADKLAKQMGVAKHYVLLPFKGLYLKSHYNEGNVVTNIYPVPNLNNPFLGVHFTKTIHGDIKIGPTAIPAFWRENYQGLQNFNPFELAEILYYQTKLFAKNSFNFRRLALTEMKNYFPRVMVKEAKKLVHTMHEKTSFMKAGIRAQLLDTQKNQLIMDFVIEQTPNSTHILNAVSPAFTCSFAFAEYVCA